MNKYYPIAMHKGCELTLNTEWCMAKDEQKAIEKLSRWFPDFKILKVVKIG